jgi:hypothetical protein
MPKGLPGDWQYGILNSIKRPTIGKSLDWYDQNPWFAIRQVVQDSYVPNALANTGPYRGIVLRVEPNATAADYNDPNDASYMIAREDPAAPPDLVRLKVRIPELHSALPVPTAWGDTAQGIDQVIIDMYPTFVAQSDLVVTPGPSDLVWVDYTNKNDFTDPIYIRPITEKKYFMEQVGSLIASEIMKACAATTPGTGGSAGDSTAGVNTSGAQPYPTGARKEPLGETEIIEDTEMPPQSGIKASLLEMVNKAGLKVKGWAGRLPSNGGREVIILAPLTTDFGKPIEVAHWLHGGGSWFSPGTPRFLISDLKKMGAKGRNIVLVLPQLPFTGQKFSKFAKAGGKESVMYNGGKGGDYAKLHADCLNLINKEIIGAASPAQIGFVSIACHSRGGFALKKIATSNQLAQIKPDKITCADSDFIGSGGGTSTKEVWRKYIKTAGKNVEWNLLCSSPDYRPDDWPEKGKTDKVGGVERKGDNGNQPRIAMQGIMLTEFGKTVSTVKVVAEKEITGGKVFVTYAPYNLGDGTHRQIGLKAFIFDGPLATAVPSKNKTNSEVTPEVASNPEGAVSEEVLESTEPDDAVTE